MPNIQVHVFRDGIKTTALLSERTIETHGFIRFFPAIHSVADHYDMTTFPSFGCTTSPMFTGIFANFRDEYKNLPNNKARINFCCDKLGKPHIFPEV